MVVSRWKQWQRQVLRTRVDDAGKPPGGWGQAKLARDKDEHQSFQDKRGTFMEFKKSGGKCFKKKRDGLI